MIGLNTASQLGIVAFDVLRNDFHRPIVDGKCNRENIEDAIIDGIYKGELDPMNKTDVEFVCNLIDDMIEMYAK
jgi:hypothetical protein